MKTLITTILLGLLLCVSAAAQRFTTPPAGWTEQPVQDGQAILDKLLAGKKMAVFSTAIVGTERIDSSPRRVCSDDGTVCRVLVDSTWWMDLAYQDGDSSMFVVSARCAPFWSSMGQSCDLPILGAQDDVVIERRKKGKYSVYIALRQGSLDKKGSVSKYEIVDLRHFKTR